MGIRQVSHLVALCLLICGCASMPPQHPQIAAGDEAAKKTQFRSAIALYTQAIESQMLAPEALVEAHMKRAHAYLQEAEFNTMADSDLVEALTDAVVAGRLAPEWSNAIDLQATLFQRLGAYREALVLFQQSYRIDKSDPYWSLISIGETYRMMGDYDTALRYYNHVLERSDLQRGMPIYYHRGLTFFRAGRYREAIESLGEGLKFQPDWPFAYVYRACAYARIGDYGKANSDYDVALATWQRAASQYGQAAVWKSIRDRLIAESSATKALSSGAMAAIDPSRFCEEYTSYAVHRERSEILAPEQPDLAFSIFDFESVTRN